MAVREQTVWITEPAADFIADLTSDIRRVFPEAKTKTICNSERDAWRVEVYSSAKNADDLLQIVEDKVAEILLVSDMAITVVPLPLADYKENETPPER